jgi:hypothetical protein
MKIMIQKMYENDIAMFEKMNTKEIDKFLLVNQLKQDKVHLQIKQPNSSILNIFFSYLMQDIKQFDQFVINEIVSNKVLLLNINFQ